jgi:3-isopropylmalate/(R)-2-methylmalate dehydratase small subunit
MTAPATGRAAEAGRAWLFGDNIDTDVLAPGRYMKSGIEEIARHCLEAVDPAFAREVRPGDVVIGGRNFGAGSSREQAPQALRQLGVAALIAESFAGLFYRNALNLGLPALVCAQAKRVRAEDRLRVDPEAGRIENLSTSETLACEPIPAHLMQMIRDGGLLPHLEKRLLRERRARA